MKSPAWTATESNRRWAVLGALLFAASAVTTAACRPDESPLKTELERLQKEAARQESVIVSLQDGNKVMQQQIDLLNQELRDARKEVDRLEGERKALTAKLEAQAGEAKKLAAEAQRTAARTAQATQSLQMDEKGGQSEDISKPLMAVSKAAEEALTRNGYTVKVGIKLEQKAVYVTGRKISSPASLEVPGFRNQYLVALQTLPSSATRLSVKADFEKMAQGGRILAASPEETAEIERRLISEITKALGGPGKA
jgi:TolA-binding protein